MGGDTVEQILTYVRGLKNGNPSLEPDTDLIATGVLDSLTVMELVSYLSKTFGVKIAVTDITPANLRSVNTLGALVASKSP